VCKLPGIGPVAEARLYALGILTLGQLVAAPEALVRPIFGAYTPGILSSARGGGNDELGRERPAFREYDPRGSVAGTISNERTFGETSSDTASAVLSGLAERVASRARHRGVVAGQVTLKLRYTDFDTITRGRTIEPTNVDFEIHRVAQALYREARTRDLPIRLLASSSRSFGLMPCSYRCSTPASDAGWRSIGCATSSVTTPSTWRRRSVGGSVDDEVEITDSLSRRVRWQGSTVLASYLVVKDTASRRAKSA
jgi:DNA polymerase-4